MEKQNRQEILKVNQINTLLKIRCLSIKASFFNKKTRMGKNNSTICHGFQKSNPFNGKMIYINETRKVIFLLSFALRYKGIFHI